MKRNFGTEIISSFSSHFHFSFPLVISFFLLGLQIPPNNPQKFISLLQLRRMAAFREPYPFHLLNLVEEWLHHVVRRFVVLPIQEEGWNDNLMQLVHDRKILQSSCNEELRWTIHGEVDCSVGFYRCFRVFPIFWVWIDAAHVLAVEDFHCSFVLWGVGGSVGLVRQKCVLHVLGEVLTE